MDLFQSLVVQLIAEANLCNDSKSKPIVMYKRRAKLLYPYVNDSTFENLIKNEQDCDIIANTAFSILKNLHESKMLHDKLTYRASLKILVAFGEVFMHHQKIDYLDYINTILKDFVLDDSQILMILKKKFPSASQSYNIELFDKLIPLLDRTMRLSTFGKKQGPLAFFVARLKKGEPFDEEQFECLIVKNIRLLTAWIRFTDDRHRKQIRNVLCKFADLFRSMGKNYLLRFVTHFVL